MNFTLKNKKKQTLGLASICLVTLAIFGLKERILLLAVEYKMVNVFFREDIIRYLSKKEAGEGLAMKMLLNHRDTVRFSFICRGAPLAILCISPLKKTNEDLDKLIWTTITEDTVCQIMVGCEVMLARINNKLAEPQEKDRYLNRLYQLVKDPDEYKGVSGYKNELYSARLCVLQHAADHLSDEQFTKLYECTFAHTGKCRFPLEIDTLFGEESLSVRDESLSIQIR